MIFGYVVVVLAGFFLTAVPNWTGEPEAKSKYVMWVAALWLSGRVAVWFSALLPDVLVALLDLAFLPILSVRLAFNLFKRPKMQNTALLGLLALIFAANLLVHIEWIGLARDTAQRGLWLGLFATCAFIAVIGGRVVPAFTRNVMVRQGVSEGLPLTRHFANRASVVSTVALGPLYALGVPELVLGTIAGAAAISNGWRLKGWRSMSTKGDSLLWALHLGFALLVLGYALLAISWLTGLIGPVSAMHALSMGAVGGMTIAMMTRAPLGHTGRPLRAGRAATASYILILLAMIVRVGGAEWLPDFYQSVILISGLVWVLAFALYIFAYWPVLTGPDFKGNTR